jgi:hypothetical protein
MNTKDTKKICFVFFVPFVSSVFFLDRGGTYVDLENRL